MMCHHVPPVTEQAPYALERERESEGERERGTGGQGGGCLGHSVPGIKAGNLLTNQPPEQSGQP